jgi:hypothetical protein
MITRREAIAGAAAIGAVCVVGNVPVAAASNSTRITFAEVMPRLPVDCQTWLNSLTPGWRNSTEYILNLIGEENFSRCWRVHRDDLDQLGFDFGIDPRTDGIGA